MRTATAMALVLATGACTGDTGTREVPRDTRSLIEMARAVGSDVMERLARGYVPGRSGDILLVPEPWNVVAQWNGGLRGPGDPRTTHATPWSHHQRVPIILYGPGFIRGGARATRPVDVADLAPTFAELMAFDFDAPDGEVLGEALLPPRRRREPPRAIVLVVYDGGGWNVLQHWPDAWPVERRLAEEGTTFVNATIGSAPSVTAPIHSTMGTGAYPRTHGVPENTARLPDGSVGDIYLEEADPNLVSAETLADAWDRANGNRPWVGMLGYESWHLGMMGGGAASDGGDRDAAVLWERDLREFWTNEEFYELPDYLPPPRVLDQRVRALDASDGALDATWRGNTLEEDAYQFTGTPAFAAYQGDAILEMIRREPIGRDDRTDLLFVEMKPTDLAGHVWNMLGDEERAVLRAQDQVLGRMVALLDRKVGVGRYVLAVTADHGQSPLPESVNGLRIDRFELAGDVEEQFAASIVQAVHPSELYVDWRAVDLAGIRLEEVARFIGDYRYGDGLPDGTDEAAVAPELLDEQVFAAAFPGSFVAGLTEAEIEALGPGRYAEGDLTTPPAISALGESP